jgi:Actin
MYYALRIVAELFNLMFTFSVFNENETWLVQGSFQQMWISKQEYEEGGKSCVEKKCP